jgi:hypothetical protein
MSLSQTDHIILQIDQYLQQNPNATQQDVERQIGQQFGVKSFFFFFFV